MKKIVKQVVGIDVAKDELVVCLGRMQHDWSPELYAAKTFPNTAKGFSALVEWVNKLADDKMPVRYVMEATGVYHQSLAYWLDEKELEVTIVLPTKSAITTARWKPKPLPIKHHRKQLPVLDWKESCRVGTGQKNSTNN